MSPYDSEIDNCINDIEAVNQALDVLEYVDNSCISLRGEIILYEDMITDGLHVPIQGPLVSMIGSSIDGIVQIRTLLTSIRSSVQGTLGQLNSQRVSYYETNGKDDEYI